MSRTSPPRRLFQPPLRSLARLILAVSLALAIVIALAPPSRALSRPPSGLDPAAVEVGSQSRDRVAALSWPQRRFAACGAMDPATGTLYVFGGRAEGGASHHRDAWALTPGGGTGQPSWQLLAPGTTAGAPPPTRSCSAVFDPQQQRLLVFGGWDGITPQNSVWALDVASAPATWTLLCDASSCGAPPSPRRAAQAVYDPARNRMVLFGGTDGTYRNDLWSLSLDGAAQWTPVAPVTPAPLGRGGHSLVVDPGRDRLWLFGGTRTGPDLNDVWTFDLAAGAWTQVLAPGCTTCPSARSGAALVHDEANDQLVLHGGWQSGDNVYPRDTWALVELGGQPRWQQVTADSDEPRPRSFAVAGYDPNGDQLLVFGGGEGASAIKDTAALLLPADGSEPRWRGVQPDTALTARDQVAAHYDHDDGQLVAFGGFGSGTFPGSVDAGTHLADTWRLDLGRSGRWQGATPDQIDAVPLAREATAYASDDGGNRLFAFGGLTGDASLADVWLFDGEADTWSQLCSPRSCGPGPSARWGAHASYDPSDGGRLVVFGGRSGGSTTYADTWVLELTPTPTWRQLDPGGPGPSARWGAAVGYDHRHHRLVVFGGQAGPDSAPTVFGDTWTLDLAGQGTWSPVAGPGPSPRRSPAYALRRVEAAPSSRADPLALVIFGGLDTAPGGHHNDVWSLDLRGPTPAWTQHRADDCTGGAEAPACRRSASATYDPATDTFVTVFGRDGSQFFADAWRYSFTTARWQAIGG